MSFLHHLHHQIPERPPSTVWVISHWTCTTSCSILCTPRSYGKALPNQMLQNHLFSLCIFACFLPPPLPLRTHFMMPDMRARPNTTTPLSTFGVDRFEYIYIYRYSTPVANHSYKGCWPTKHTPVAKEVGITPGPAHGTSKCSLHPSLKHYVWSRRTKVLFCHVCPVPDMEYFKRLKKEKKREKKDLCVANWRRALSLKTITV